MQQLFDYFIWNFMACDQTICHSYKIVFIGVFLIDCILCQLKHTEVSSFSTRSHWMSYCYFLDTYSIHYWMSPHTKHATDTEAQCGRVYICALSEIICSLQCRWSYSNYILAFRKTLALGNTYSRCPFLRRQKSKTIHQSFIKFSHKLNFLSIN